MRTIESTLPAVTGGAKPAGSTRGPLVDNRKIIVTAGAGAVAFVGAKYAVLKSIPPIGPVPAAAVTIVLGLALASGTLRVNGDLGALIEGAGIGLVAIGALELAGS